ncbi:hypothetical protein B0H21DRAFT_719747 [Amylocystis lapponica]|nr:hypothetical protein B0H21DRAFT_719747 [Amylocystis lapponica]
MTSVAPAPFNKPNADVILRTSDNVDFHVHKLILSEASPIFETMFGLPQPATPVSTETQDGNPVVHVSENAQALDRLLRICYPTADPVLDTIEDVRSVLEAAEKYDMESARALCIRAFMVPKIFEKEPFAVYAIAYYLRLEDETRKAARMTLRFEFPNVNPTSPSPLGLELISGRALYALIDYRSRCSQAARNAVDDYNMWRRWEEVEFMQCPKCNPAFYAGVEDEPVMDVYFLDMCSYWTLARNIFAQNPCERAGLNEELACSAMLAVDPPKKACSACREGLVSSLLDVNAAFMEAVHQAISRETLQLEF